MGVQSDMEIVQMVGIQRKYLDTLMISLQECHAARLKVLESTQLIPSFLLVVGLVGSGLTCFESITGWWFGTFFIFPYIGNHHPN